jgi:class 3 adenylate cyclase
MLPIAVQHQLYDYYAPTSGHRGQVKTGFQTGFVEGIQGLDLETDKEAYSAVVYVDIAGFSAATANMSAAQVRKFLDGYYQRAIVPLIDSGGRIDRIAGDGIIAVFSTVFEPHQDRADVENAAFDVARKLVRELSSTAYAAKAAIATGDLLFCKTGVARMWEEITVIGTPLTELYRIEESAQRDEVVLRAGSALGRRFIELVRQEEDARALEGRRINGPHWLVNERDRVLRGLYGGSPVQLLVQKWIPRAPA